MKAAELRAMDEAGVREQLDDLHGEWRNLRFQEAVGKLTATARVREIRKTIARIHTIRTERETEAATRAFLAQRQQTQARTTPVAAPVTEERRVVVETVAPAEPTTSPAAQP